MTSIVLILGGLLITGIPSPGDTLDTRFVGANQAYEQGQYESAEERYRTLLDSGYASGALYYNLGNTYARLDKPGQAIRYYEKARRLRPGDIQVEHNLEQVRRDAGVYPERLDVAASRTPWGLVRNWSPLALFVGGSLLFSLGLGLAVFWTQAGRSVGLRHPLAWGPVLGGLLLVAVAMGTSYLQSTHHRAVVIAEATPLRASPGEDLSADSTLVEGRMVEVLRRSGEWHEVRLADGTTGWVPGRSLGDI